MNTRFFLLLERQQKLDARLRLAQSLRDADPLEIARLHAGKRTLRQRLAQLMGRSAPRLA
ncbi:DUF465 domain-containing protein [Novosphingobium sp. RD2P27]|uniref:DUF465 domain-containing protein n=1 Tax=Novosphingobium kalidii TaxID=3230299 RepID=A0ABV2D086_9SPHN